MNYKEYLKENKVDFSEKELRREISGLITEARLYAGFSQNELAKAMGTTQSSIARAEGGQMQPSLEFLEKVAEAVNTKLIYPKFEFMLNREKEWKRQRQAKLAANYPKVNILYQYPGSHHQNRIHISGGRSNTLAVSSLT